MQVTTPSFSEGGTIPGKHAYHDQNLSPSLQWTGVPEGTRSLALICDDPDAPRGTWVHWVLFHLPGDLRELPEGVPASKVLPNGARHGTNDFGKIGYGGPAPPPGKPHRYFFKLYALDAVPGVKEGATKQQLIEAMTGHILAEAQVMGTFAR